MVFEHELIEDGTLIEQISLLLELAVGTSARDCHFSPRPPLLDQALYRVR